MADLNLSGRCLCGAVHYAVTGTPMRFVHCHCRRCRKATGTGHATNLIVKADGVEWSGRTDLVKRFKLPEAERFSTAFCTDCGGPLPREGRGMVVIPAGSLESLPELKPEGRIFWESRAAWSCGAGDLPVHAEYPPAAG